MKSLVTIFILLDFAYQLFIYRISSNQQKKALPEEVADIYDEKRYQTFIGYKNENKKLSFITKLLTTSLDLALIHLGFFSYLESSIGNQPYLLVLVSVLLLLSIHMVISYGVDYYRTFVINEKYNKNKKDLKEFHKDFFLENLLEVALSLVLYLFVTFVCEKFGFYSDHHTITYLQATLIFSIVLFIFGLIIIFFSFMTYFSLKKQYTFVEMEHNELRSKIEAMMETSKKKVKRIQIYNESKKSTRKNAFLLKLLWIREFGIADNFINENSEKELLAVLAHEIGHLKHKKDIYDYMKYTMFGVIIILFIGLFVNNQMIKDMNTYLLNSFDLTYNNYYFIMMVFSFLLNPIFILVGAFLNTITRKQEYEADRHSVEMGYGEELIRTFKRLSNDELVDVNPAPFIEFMNYDHPGMYNRIKAIQKAMNK